MRQLIVQEWITIDGFAADENGSVDFFADSVFKDTADQYLLNFIDSIDHILLGSKTYRLFAEYWPQATVDKEIVADKLNATPKIVFSRSMDNAPWGKWNNASIADGDLRSEISVLKGQPGKDIVVWGSLSLARSLMQAGLVDELQLFICPVALGKGKPVFPETMSPFKLEMVGIQQYGGGLLLVTYKPQS